MKAGDWKCPQCGEGFRDVAPELEIGPDHMVGYEMLPGSRGAKQGTCRTGHVFLVGWTLGPDGAVTFDNFTVEARHG